MNENTQGVAAQPADAQSEADPRNPNIDPKMVEAAAAEDKPEPPAITELIYMPGPADPDTTVVDTVEFKAYEPTTISGARLYLGAKLHANPFFTSAHDVKPEHDERKQAWAANREAKRNRDAAQAEVDKLEA